MRKIFFALLLVAVVAGLVGFLWRVSDEAQRQAEEKYLGKTLEVKDYYLDKRFTFKVNRVNNTLGTLNLYGTLIFDRPEGATYLGATPGSLTVNWQGSNGKGFTWFLREYWRLKTPRDGETPQIIIDDVAVS